MIKTDTARRVQRRLRLRTAMVVSTAGGEYRLLANSRLRPARRAAGCLLEPEAGDRVLVAAGKPCYILTVLERAAGDPTPARLVFPTGVHLQAGQGAVRITTPEDLALAAGGDVTVLGGRLRLQAEDGEAVFSRFRYFGKFVLGQVDRLKLAVDTADTFIRQLTEKLVWSSRQVQEMDDLEAGAIRRVAAQTLTIHAENATLLAEENVKIDAAQIHLG